MIIDDKDKSSGDITAEDLTSNEIVPVNQQQLPEKPELSREEKLKLAAIPLQKEQDQIVADIIAAPSKDVLDQQFNLFNISQSKKNALRIIKLNGLLDKVEDQAIARFERRPDQISNKELLDYMNIVSDQIDKAQHQVEELSSKPSIVVANQKNEVNINMGDQPLDRESKEHVMDAVAALLKQIQNNNPVLPSSVIDAENDQVENNTDIIVEDSGSTDLLNGDGEDF